MNDDLQPYVSNPTYLPMLKIYLRMLQSSIVLPALVEQSKINEIIAQTKVEIAIQQRLLDAMNKEKKS